MQVVLKEVFEAIEVIIQIKNLQKREGVEKNVLAIIKNGLTL